MNFKYFYLLPLVVCNLFLVACRNDSTQAQTLFVEHYVRYDEEAKTIKATATFKIGDSVHHAKAAAIQEGVVLNGAPLRETTTDLGVNYNIEGPKAKFDAAYRFSFKNPLTQKLYETEFLLAAATNIAVKGGILDKKQGGTITWDGGKLADGEELSLRIEDSAGENNEINIVGNGNNEPLYEFRGGQLDGIASGKATLYVIRTKVQTIGQPNVPVKGKLQTQYFAVPIPIIIQ